MRVKCRGGMKKGGWLVATPLRVVSCIGQPREHRWRGRDSNPRPLGYEPNELPLLHPASSCPAPAFTLPPPIRGPGAPATASPPTGLPLQYSPALPRVTTGFGMGPGGATALSATGTPDPPTWDGHAHTSLFSLQSTLPRGPRSHMLTTSPSRLGNGARRHTSEKSALVHAHGSAPVCYQPSTPRRSTWSSPRELTSCEWGSSSWKVIPA
jgi:hypothetical protein